MNIDDDTKRFIFRRLKWPIIYVGLGLVLVLVLPFPYDLASVLGLFILINFLRGRSILKKYGGTGGIRDLFDSLSSSMSSANNQSRPLKYFCMSPNATLYSSFFPIINEMVHTFNITSSNTTPFISNINEVGVCRIGYDSSQGSGNVPTNLPSGIMPPATDEEQMNREEGDDENGDDENGDDESAETGGGLAGPIRNPRLGPEDLSRGDVAGGTPSDFELRDFGDSPQPGGAGNAGNAASPGGAGSSGDLGESRFSSDTNQRTTTIVVHLPPTPIEVILDNPSYASSIFS
jgi:hypothetical protein